MKRILLGILATPLISGFLHAVPPANDDRASPENLVSLLATSTTGTLEEASQEPMEPALSEFADFDVEPTVWFQWTAIRRPTEFFAPKRRQ